MTTNLNKDLISIADLTTQDVINILDKAQALKANRTRVLDLEGKTLGMIFQQPSTRTSISFSVAMYELGGYSLTLNHQNLQTKRGETMADTARTLSRYLSGIMIRATSHKDVQELAHHATIPVISGLTDKEHPCQVLADLLTIRESLKLQNIQDLSQHRVTYVGDGNNMAHSWMLAAGLLGFTLVISSPEKYDPEKNFLDQATTLGQKTGGKIILERDPHKAVQEASVIYTDVWASMGKDEERDARKKIFHPYQVNTNLIKQARQDAIVMHCLPAHRGEEITEDVLEGPQSVVFDQAENRLHVQKAILLHCLL